MARLVGVLLREAFKLLNRLFNVCWLIPRQVDDGERIVRAIYSPYHLDKKKRRITREAYEPTPSTDEVSIMRLEHMGTFFCKRKARSFEHSHKKYQGFAVLRTSAVRASDMDVSDSRQHYCGHGEIRLMVEELRGREPQEPLPPQLGKRVKELKDRLKDSSHYVADPFPNSRWWKGEKLEPPK